MEGPPFEYGFLKNVWQIKNVTNGMWAITTIFSRVEVTIGASEMWGENLAQRPVYGDIIIIQVGVNGEADLQISHTWMTANYWIIQEAIFLAPPDHPHVINTQTARKRGDSGERFREEGPLSPPLKLLAPSPILFSVVFRGSPLHSVGSPTMNLACL